MKKKIGIVGTFLGGAGVVGAMQTVAPADAIEWTDWAVHLIERGGMPLIILLLLLALGGAIYYYERVKLPEKEEREDHYEAQIQELNTAALDYRDKVLERLEKMVTAGTEANTRLEMVLQQVVTSLEALKTSKGRSNGSA